MKLSNKVVYGLQFLLHLAEDKTNRYIQINDIVKKEDLSEKYLEKVASLLKEDGLVSGKRGSNGGYRLAKQLNEISMKDVFYALEGVELTPDNLAESAIGESINVKAIREVVNYFEDALIKILSSQTLEDLQHIKNRHLTFSNYQI